MSTPSFSAKHKRVDELIEGAVASLGRLALFEAERMAMKAITLAKQVEDYQRLAAAVPPLLEARTRRTEQAVQAGQEGQVTVIQEPVTDQFKLTPGCFLVQPPLVGADARRLRMAALQSEVPVLVICREPLTKLGFWPVVAIGPGATVRTKIDPPDEPEQPDVPWFIMAIEALGAQAIAGIDGETEVTRRIKHILERLDTVPDHDGLHHLLQQTCLEAAKLAEAAAARAAAKPTGKRKAKV